MNGLALGCLRRKGRTICTIQLDVMPNGPKD